MRIMITIEVFCTEYEGQVVLFDQVGGIGEEKVRVGLQMDEATIGEEMAIAVEEPRGGESLTRVLHLWVAEGEPYLADFVRGEEAVDDLDIGAQEGHILQSFVQGLCGACPHAGALDVDANEIDIGKQLSQSDGIFTLATAQLQDNGVVVMEILLVPMALQVKGHVFHYRIGVLEHVLVGFHIGEFRQLSFTHGSSCFLVVF